MNILIITNWSYKVKSGGVENYNRLLYKNFPNINFIEFTILDDSELSKNEISYKNVEIINYSKKFNFINNKIVNKKYIFFTKIKEIFFINKILEKIIKKHQIDKIIFSGDYFFCRKFLKKYKDKIFFIQHTHPTHYIPYFYLKKVKLKYLRKINWWLLYRNDFFKYVKNIISFDFKNTEIIKKYFKNKQIFEISLPSKFKFQKSDSLKYDVITIARKEKAMIDLYKEIIKASNFNFLSIGCELDVKQKHFTYIDFLNDDELLKKFLESKFLLLLTYIDGFPFVAVEALSLGKPIILFNNFPSASFLVGENGERGLLINNYENAIEEIIEFLKKCNYNKLSTNCFDWANKNLTIDIFVKKWWTLFN